MTAGEVLMSRKVLLSIFVFVFRLTRRTRAAAAIFSAWGRDARIFFVFFVWLFAPNESLREVFLARGEGKFHELEVVDWRSDAR